MPSFPTAHWHLCGKYGYGSKKTHVPYRIVDHNAEGYRAGLFSVLDGPRKASWHFSVMRNGEVWQHMSTARLAWHAGSFAANNGSIGIEHEGKKGQPLTSAQYQATLRLHKWIFETHGFGPPSRQTTLREHKEFDYTDCPSGRIPWTWLIKDLTEEEDMPLTDADKKWIIGEIGHRLAGDDSGSLALILNSIDDYPRLKQELEERIKNVIATEGQGTGAGLKRGDTVKLE